MCCDRTWDTILNGKVAKQMKKWTSGYEWDENPAAVIEWERARLIFLVQVVVAILLNLPQHWKLLIELHHSQRLICVLTRDDVFDIGFMNNEDAMAAPMTKLVRIYSAA